MRKEDDDTRLNNLNIFNLDRLKLFNNYESGTSATLGFDYKIKNLIVILILQSDKLLKIKLIERCLIQV